jgi:hypothetical protein
MTGDSPCGISGHQKQRTHNGWLRPCISPGHGSREAGVDEEGGRDSGAEGSHVFLLRSYIGGGTWIISLTSAAVSGRAMNLFLSASDSTRSSPRISSGHSVALGKY